MEQAMDGREVIGELTITDNDIDQYMAHRTFSDSVDLVVFTAPQLSSLELKKLAELLDGKTVSENVRLIVTTNSTNYTIAQDLGYAQQIFDSGGLIFKGTCWYTMDPAAQRKRFGWRRLVTNSAKLANIIQAHGFTPVIRRTEHCIDAALSGRL